MKTSYLPFILLSLILFYSCSSTPHPKKKIDVPFSKGTTFKVSQGPFGGATHSEKGNEYSWDFDVPYGTDVLTIEDGVVIQVWEPRKGGGCNSKFSDDAHNVKIELADKSVVQYVHVDSLVNVGAQVRRGEIVAKTAKNGFICNPQLHFSIYKSKDHLYSSPHRETLPLYFNEFPNGELYEGESYRVK